MSAGGEGVSTPDPPPLPLQGPSWRCAENQLPEALGLETCSRTPGTGPLPHPYLRALRASPPLDPLESSSQGAPGRELTWSPAVASQPSTEGPTHGEGLCWGELCALGAAGPGGKVPAVWGWLAPHTSPPTEQCGIQIRWRSWREGRNEAGGLHRPGVNLQKQINPICILNSM